MSLRFAVCLLMLLVTDTWFFEPVAYGTVPGKRANKIEVLIPAKPNEDGLALKHPFGVDFDSSGTMWIVELDGGRVHQWTPNRDLTHVSGNGKKGYTGDGGPMSKAVFNGMHNVAITRDDDVYIADSWNHCVRKIDGKTGIVSTFAGTGKSGFSGDGGPASKATFDFIMCITLTPKDDGLLIADLKNRRIRHIDLKTKVVSTIAGNGKKGVPKDGTAANSQPLVDPRAVTMDAKRTIYILERGGHALRRVSTDGKITTVAGTGKAGFKDGPAAQAQFGAPKHVCVDQHDCVIIADDNNASIRIYDPKSETVSTLLGRGFGDASIKLRRPHGVTIHQQKLYVVDSGNNRIISMDHGK